MPTENSQRKTCPRCQEVWPDEPLKWNFLNEILVRNGLSRKDNSTYICTTCELAEAIADYLKIPFEQARADFK